MTMSDGKKLTIAEFFDGISGGDERYELVEGVARAMVRAKQGHNVIRSNVLAVFVPAGKSRGCRATSVNTGVQTGPNTIRYPDVVVDRGPRDAEAMTASKPVVVVEVLAGSSAVFDRSAKLREYQSVESVDTVIQIAAEKIHVEIHRKQQEGTWTEEAIAEFEVEIQLPALSTSISLNEIYDSLDPRLPDRQVRKH
jgi:Uma2 family endonuclease